MTSKTNKKGKTMRLTYRDALNTIIENTEIGYTLASQDRLWIVFTFDLWSEGDHLSLKYNRLYPRGLEGAMAYDLDMSGVQVWTTRAEAEHFAQQWRERLAESQSMMDDGIECPVYVMNLGDDARYEKTVIGADYGHPRTTPKYKGSEAAWQAMTEMAQRWAEEVSPHIYQ